MKPYMMKMKKKLKTNKIMKQSAVEWLVSELKKYDSVGLKDQSNYVIEMPTHILTELEEQAKEMEKQQQDNFAIKFTNWCEDYYYPSSAKDIWYDKPDFSNAKKFTTKELLEMYKKEKGV